MRHLCAVVSVAALFGLAGCGGGSTTPTPVVAAPSISTPNNVVYLGQTVPFAATGTGPIRWGGDAPGVATVDAATGRVTGVGIGRVTIWAENEGGRTTRLLRVLPSFGGTWRGSYVVENCQAAGVFSAFAFCGTTIRIGDRSDGRATAGGSELHPMTHENRMWSAAHAHAGHRFIASIIAMVPPR